MQAQVMEYMTAGSVFNKSLNYRGLIFDFFSRKGFEQPEMEMMNFVSIMKGFSMQYVFAPSLFPDNILEGYKGYLKMKFVYKKVI